jgi:hypothetical protein
MDTPNSIPVAVIAESCKASKLSVQVFSERLLVAFYNKLESEYGFRQPGFHGEQDWSELFFVISFFP